MSSNLARRRAKPLRAIAIASLALAGGMLLASCGDDGPLGGDVTLPDVSAPDITAPDVSLPDVTLPDVTTPDVTLPNVTAPDLPGTGGGSDTTAAPAPAQPASPSDVGEESSDDSGLGPFGIVTLLLLAGLIGALIVWLTRRGDTPSGAALQHSQLARNLDRLVDDARWASRQSLTAVTSTDLGRVVGAWPVTRDHFADIERVAASIDVNDPVLTEAIDGVGRAMAELRGALDAYVDAAGRHDGHLDALSPLRDGVTVRCDNLETRVQALTGARRTSA
ncbi:hypothetical protein [Candidatus Neomicrothrix sp.]|uniref:hypothetical protein n=1 Tax=Candidatus Neomicrothrix sp. TaxID=2719034 RepID=UPI001B4E8489|nr:hypothetical protein [Candidatus Microthrix sp.]MBP7406643.1 hypothetical protein [Candidatus Microthrix sp.]MBP7877493.1 hypothetical protein [Candidatus Microthrix sp.]